MKLYHFKDGLCNASGAKIRILRESRNMSQEQLASSLQLMGLNLNQKAISRIETGERVVPDFELLYFSKAFEIPITELFPCNEQLN